MHFILALLQNAAFLLALVLIYQVLSSSRRPISATWSRQLIPGVGIAGIACIIMLTPIEYQPGIILDTRTVLISLCGLFFGVIPTLVTVVSAVLLRLYLGGIAVWSGVGIILATAAIGLIWGHYRRPSLARISPLELYVFGVVVHLTMVGTMFTLPGDIQAAILSDFALPTLLLLPVVTMLLGMLLSDGLRGQITEQELEEKGEHLLLALSASKQTLFDANLLTGEISFEFDRIQGADQLRRQASVPEWIGDLHPEDRGRVEEVYAAIASGALPEVEIEFRERTLQGRWAWISLAGRVVAVDESGRPARMLGTFTEVTARKEGEHRLSVFRELLDHSLDGFEVMDPITGDLLDVNQAICRELGYTREELLGMRVFDIELQVNPESFSTLVHRLRESGSLEWEGRHLRKDGTTYPVEVKISLVVLERDYLVAAVRNVTERRAMEQKLLVETARRQNLIEQSRDGIVTLDEFGGVFEANLSFAEMLGYTKEEVETLNVWDWERHTPRETVLQMIASVDETGDHFETRHTRKDGSVIDVEISTNATTISGRKLIFCVCRDITERKQIEASLRLAALVYHNSREAMMVTDAETRIIAINPVFTQITGYTLDDVYGRDPRVLQSGNHGREFYDAMWAELRENGHWSGEIFNRRKSGEIFPESLSISAVYDTEGNVQSWVAQFSDITEKKGAEHLIWQQANFDSLTGLPNRRMFQDRLSQEIRKTKRSGRSLALLFLDLDNFKEVNDTLGHDMGDRLLQQTAERLRDCVRETDIIARLGGDEFTIVLTELGGTDNVGNIAQKILWRLAEPFTLDNEVAYVSGSVGITLCPADATDAEGLLKNADQAMYGAKGEGRNCYRYFTVAMQDAINRRMRLANDLRDAVAGGQLFVVYQPIVNLVTGEVRKAEALVRWNHPREGLIAPSSFIKIAEETGLIGRIGTLVLHEVVAKCKRWRSVVPDLQISMNKSPAEFDAYGREGMMDPGTTLLREHGLPGNCLVLEITEGLLLTARPEILQQLRTLRDAGVEVALDDFGTGYSSLSYLKKFDIDYLKIDQSFMSNLDQGDEDLALCEAIITMAHRLGLEVIAEGVETQAQADLLREIRCDYAQGYLFSPAISAEEMETLLYNQVGSAVGSV